MKKEWEVRPLGEVVEVQKTKFNTGGLPYVGMEDIASGTGEFLGSPEPKKVKSATFRFSREHVLYGRLRPYLNKVLVPNFDGHCSSEVFPIKPISRVDKRFLFHWLTWDRTVQKIDTTSTGTRMPRANFRDVLDFLFPLPQLEEQKRIVAVLDEAFEGIVRARANTEANLQNARELFDSQLENEIALQFANYGRVELNEICDVITDGDHQPPPKSQTGLPFITISNIDKERFEIDFADTFLVPRSYFNSLKEHRRPRNGDVLYSVTGSFGIPVVVKTNREFCFQRHIGLIRPLASISSRWLFFVLRSQNLRTQAEKSATGTAQRTVSLNALRSMAVPKTPQKDQLQLAKKLDAVCGAAEGLLEVQIAKLDSLDQLKQSILQKAFEGELT